MNVYKSYLEYKKLWHVEEHKLYLLKEKLKSLYAPTDREEIETLKVRLRLQEAYVEKLREEVKKMDDQFLALTINYGDIEGQIFYHKYIKLLTLKEIAGILNKSYSYVCKVSDRIKKRLENND